MQPPYLAYQQQSQQPRYHQSYNHYQPPQQGPVYQKAMYWFW
jgi:hypothetical protein